MTTKKRTSLASLAATTTPPVAPPEPAPPTPPNPPTKPQTTPHSTTATSYPHTQEMSALQQTQTTQLLRSSGGKLAQARKKTDTAHQEWTHTVNNAVAQGFPIQGIKAIMWESGLSDSDLPT